MYYAGKKNIKLFHHGCDLMKALLQRRNKLTHLPYAFFN
jgi:hypothetical protein